MSYDADDEIIQFLMKEASGAMPTLVEKMVDPWVRATVADVLGGKVLSAGPTRSGDKVQIRYRLGSRLVASSHSLCFLRDASMEFVSPQTASPFIRGEVTRTIVRPEVIEVRLRSNLVGHLRDSCDRVPPDVLARAKSAAQKSGVHLGRKHQGDIHRLSREYVQDLKVDSLVLSAPGVLPAMEAILGRASELAVSVPHHMFSDSGHRQKHAIAKRKLLKALKAAFVAGVTDAELESLKNEALVHQIMQ